MKFEILYKGIKIYGKEDFNPQHILECGQVFCFEKNCAGYVVFPADKRALIIEEEQGYFIKTTTPKYFCDWFDLDRDYSLIKKKLSNFPILTKPIEFGNGIRILRQDKFEALISFIISANNNIKRIKLILNRLRELSNGVFPSYSKLLEKDIGYFKEIGAGYRAEYLYKVLRQITPSMLEEWQKLPTKQLREKLISLSGVGPKVADCVLLFGYNRPDVFPVDTWIHQMYNSFYTPLDNREKIRNNLVMQFKELSGFAQQYLFYYQRSSDKIQQS